MMYKRFIKRGLDIFLSTLGIIILAPFLLLICIFIMIDSKGPIIFTQKRVGKDSTHFNIYKFRTMKVDTPKEIPTHLLDNPNFFITNTGRFLRKTSLDELPQLFNILKGDMAVIGPRPERPIFVKEIAEIMPFYETRHIIKPGLTGWAQVNYSYGETIDDSLIKLQYDLYYIKHRSIYLDMNIAFKTITTILFYRGQ